MNRADLSADLSAELDRVEAADLAWFRHHPEAEQRVRRATVAEQLGWFLSSGGQVIGERLTVVRHDYWDRQGNLVRSRIGCPEL